MQARISNIPKVKEGRSTWKEPPHGLKLSDSRDRNTKEMVSVEWKLDADEAKYSNYVLVLCKLFARLNRPTRGGRCQFFELGRFIRVEYFQQLVPELQIIRNSQRKAGVGSQVLIPDTEPGLPGIRRTQ